MTQPKLFHTPSREEIEHGYRVSDSEVVDAIRLLKMYAEQVKEARTKFYFDAKKEGREDLAAAHLKRYQQACYMIEGANDINTWYNGTK